MGTKIFFFIALLIFSIILIIYYNYIVGIIVFVIPFIFNFFNKYFLNDLELIDNKIKRLTKNNKFLIIIGLLFIIFSGILFYFNEFPNKKVHQKEFGGIVWDKENNLLNDVIVYLPELNLTDTTDDLGKFHFTIDKYFQTTIDIIASKKGYETNQSEGTIGNPNYAIILGKNEN